MEKPRFQPLDSNLVQIRTQPTLHTPCRRTQQPTLHTTRCGVNQQIQLSMTGLKRLSHEPPEARCASRSAIGVLIRLLCSEHALVNLLLVGACDLQTLTQRQHILLGLLLVVPKHAALHVVLRLCIQDAAL